MEPFPLATGRLLLDQPTAADVDRIARYCADPVFEKLMTTPWPYDRQHAEYFVNVLAPSGWSSGSEWT
jgi:RimJ/RimL family protein N-acetyltransferase